MADGNRGFFDNSAFLPMQREKSPANVPEIDARAEVEVVARESGVPVRVLLAGMESVGAKSAEEGVTIARALGEHLGPRFKAGEDVFDVVQSITGDETETDRFMKRAIALGEEYYPDIAAQESGVARNTWAKINATASHITGGLLEGALNAAGTVAAAVTPNVFGLQDEVAARGTRAARAVGEAFDENAGAFEKDMSWGARLAPRGSQVTGSLVDPSTWSFGSDPSLIGYAMNITDVFGSLVPVIAASVAAGPVAGAVVGGLQGAGEGSSEGYQAVMDAARDGRLYDTPGYKRMIESGMTQDQAVQKMAELGSQAGAVFQFPVSAFGGKLTGEIVRGSVGRLVGGGTLRRALTSAAASAFEEGLQEAAETVSQRYGVHLVTGLDIDPFAGTFGDFIMGALGGAPFGAIGGFHREGTAQGDQTPGTLSPEDTPQREKDGETESLRAPLRGPLRTASDAAPGPAIGDIAPGTPVMVLASEATPVSERAPDFAGTFVEETPAGVTIADADGEIVTIPRNAFDLGTLVMTPVAPAASAGMAGPAAAPPGALDAMTPENLVREVGANADARTHRNEAMDRSAQIAAIPPSAGVSMDGVGSFVVDPDALHAFRADGDESLARSFDGWMDAFWPGVTLDGREKAAIIDTLTSRGGDATTLVESALEREMDWEDFDARSAELEAAGIAREGKPDAGAPGTVVATPEIGGRAGEARTRDTAEDAGRISDEPAPPAGDVAAQGIVQKWDAMDAPARENTLMKVGFRTFDGASLNAPGRRMLTQPWSDIGEGARMRLEPALSRPEPAEKGTPEDAALPAAPPVSEPVVPARKPERVAMEGGSAESVPAASTPAPKPPVAAPAAEAGAPERLSIEDIRSKAAVVRGLPKDQPPVIPGVSLQWDERAGGFIFSRKHRDRVARALGFDDREAASRDRQVPLSSTGGQQQEASTPTAREIGIAAAEADTKPSEEQKEAGNYRMGHIAWNGLDITIESPKGAMRSGRDSDGEEWSVRMPAHYGYIRRTTGADGDHVDIYMGPHPDNDFVLIVDQVDADTRAFDEHKVMLGFRNRKNALDTYVLGFSDGKGRDRIGGHKILTVAEFKDWLANGDQTKPARAHELAQNYSANSRSAPTAAAPASQLPIADARKAERETQARDAGRRAALDGDPLTVPGFLRGSEDLSMAWLAGYGEGIAARMPSRSQDFVEAPSGGFDFGAISPEVAMAINRQAGPIRLRQGDETWGLAHINRRHRAQFEKLGFQSAPEFVAAVAQSFNAIYPRAGRALDVVLESESTGQRLVVQLEPAQDLSGDFYDVKTASPVRQDQFKNVEPLWERTGTSTPTAQGSPPSPWGQSGDRNVSARPPESNAEPPAAPPGLKGLTDEENAELARLEAMFMDKVKHQLNTGLDPEMISVAFQIGRLYVRAGRRRFADLVRTMMDRMGLTLAQAEPYARNAYNQIRDDMELSGESIDDMDTSSDVIAEVKKMRAAEARKQVQKTPDSGMLAAGDTIVAAPDETKDKPDEQLRDQGPGPRADEAGTRRSAVDGDAGSEGGRADRTDREGDEDGAREPAGDVAGGSLGDDPWRLSDPVDDTRRGDPPPNFIIADDFALGEGSAGEKLAANLAALRLVQTLEAENRYATPEEQAVLARWVGYGGLKTVFDAKHKDLNTQWGRAQAELRKLLTPEEYYAAMRSTADAHYTSRPVVKAMWRAMRNFGFDGGRALEPTIGAGNFLGMQPGDLSARTEWYASELDPVTGRIAKHLYPQATVFDGRGFQDAPFRRASFDIAIGNPPFGSTEIRSKQHPDLGAMKVHNFIIAKTGQLLRDGGIMGMVVTHRFLDAQNDEARKALAPHFRFLGAVRLPNTAFLENAGTEVTTDIVFFQKKRESDPDGDPSWLEVDRPGPDDTRINGYFAANPHMILGRPAMDGTMYASGRRPSGNQRGEFTVHADGRDLAAALDQAIDSIRAKLPGREDALEAAVTAEPTSSTLAYGELALTDDGRIMRGEVDADGNRIVEEITADSYWKDNAEAQGRVVETLAALDEARRKTGEETENAYQRARNAAQEAGLVDLAFDPLPQKTKYETALANALPSLIEAERPNRAARDARESYAKKVEAKKLGTDGFQRLSAILDLRRRLRSLIHAERSDASNINQLRRQLRTAYRAFREAFGFLNSAKNEAILRGDVGPEMALELRYQSSRADRVEGAEEAPILEKRVIFPHKLPDRVESVADGLHLSMQERGFIDPVLIAKLTGRKTAEIIREIEAGEHPLAFRNPATGHYEMAEVYLSGNLAEKIAKAEAAGRYEHVPHLRAAMPPPKTQTQITPTIRSMWLPSSVFEDFLRVIGYGSPKVALHEVVGMASIDAGEGILSDYGKQFETDRMSAAEVFTAAVKGKIPIVYDTIKTGDGDKRIKNDEATREAVAAYERIGKEFTEWAYINPERAGKIVDAFNEKVNVVTERHYDGVRYLRQVGASPDFVLRNSQKNGSWRMIQDRMTLLHHVVGAGKTAAAITGVMERKRMGLSRKAVVAVPNHLTGQWGKEWLELYPAANILVPNEKDFEPANRAKLINRIATGDFDAVIVGHSQLVKIENDDEAMRRYAGDELEELESVMQEAKKAGGSRRTVSQMGARIEKLRNRLAAMDERLEKRRDRALLGFGQLGVDYLVVDESQEFKNLEYSTTASQLVGMNDPGGSQRAFDLLMKVRGLQAMPNGGVAFLTGTPISNSLVEIYTVMKYLIPESLKAMGIQHFDAWKAAFIQDESRFEYTASMQLKERNVMSGMVNLGPLAQLYRSFADIIMRPDVERMYREQMEAKNAAEPDATRRVSTRFPTPRVKGGQRQILLAPPTEQSIAFTRYLVMRMAGIHGNKSNKEYASIDNSLWVLTDARKASVDIRTIDQTIAREEGSKVARSAAEIHRIWKANTERRGTQLVFSDMSTPSKNAARSAQAMLKEGYRRIGLKGDALKARVARDDGRSFAARWADVVDDLDGIMSDPATPDAARDVLNEWTSSADVQDASAAMVTADTGFSFYDDLRSMLVEKGIPEGEIAFIHDYDTTAKKRDLFEAVNAGRIRVLLGSTQKMGAGTNVQARLVALHHIDAPWRPSDMEQREGRIIRQGNRFYENDPDGFEVEILAYSTERTSDVVQWQVLERKAKAIETFLNAATDSLVEEGSDADQYAEFMAQSTGKRVFLEKMQAEKDLTRENGQIASQLRAETEAERFIAGFDARDGRYTAQIAAARSINEGSLLEESDSYLADWHAASAAYLAERQRVEEENERIRAGNEGRTGKDRKTLLKMPEAPRRWQTRPENPWERTVYDTLVRVQASPGRMQTISLRGSARIRIDSAAVSNDLVSYAVYLSPDGGAEGNIRLSDGMVTAKDFRNSEKLLASFDPGRIMMRVRQTVDDLERGRARHQDMLPQMREVRERGVDTEARDALRERLAALTALARIEEVKFAVETASAGPNRFALADNKGRDLRADATAAPITGTFRFSQAGRGYIAEWGAPAGRQRVEGTVTYADRAFFEATDTSSGEPVVIEAQREGEDEEATWRATAVHEIPLMDEDDSVREMRSPPAEPIATLTGDELGEWQDVLALQRKARHWYQHNLQGTIVVNRETGWPIRFSRDGGGKIGSKGEFLLKAIPSLAEIVAGAKKTGQDADTQGREGIRAYHYFEAPVSIAGETRQLVVTIREVMDGRKFYDLSISNSGARFSEEPMGKRESRQTPDMELGAGVLNLDFAPEEINAVAASEAEPGADALAAIARDLEAWMRKAGLKQKVSVEVVRRLASGAQGLYRRSADGLGRIAVRADAPSDPLGVLRHEIIHALRAMKQFTEPEWNALVRAARRNTNIRTRIESLYADLPQARRDEEMVAELFRVWGENKANTDAPAGLMERIRSFIEALASALAGRGFHSAAAIFRAIENGGQVGKFGGAVKNDVTDDPGAIIEREMRWFTANPAKTKAETDAKERKLLSNLLTDAMGGRGGINLLALVPTRPLFTELGKNLASSRAFLALKDAMDTERQKWHAESDEIANRWRGLLARDGKANRAMMALMHEATLSGVDPAEEYVPLVREGDERLANSRRNPEAASAAKDRIAREEGREEHYRALKERFDALPEVFRGMWREVRDSYTKMADAFDQAVLDNVKVAMKIAEDRARLAYEDELRRIGDEGLTGKERREAENKALEKRDKALARAIWSRQSRVATLRAVFERNRIDGPYFPLMRYGKYFVTVRDGEGKVTGFSRFESERAQQQFVVAMENDGNRVDHGIIDEKFEARRQVDPKFIADVEELLDGQMEDASVMDAIWQRYLESLPDLSIRQSRIHRKGTPGFSGDAFRAFGRQMFHGAHQLTRLRYMLKMQATIDEARREAARANDPNRAGFIVDEMARRAAFIENPTGSNIAQFATSASFFWYLGVTPAAGIVNLTQTTMLGPVILGSASKGGVARASREIMRASHDFLGGRLSVERGKNVTADERAALRDAYDRGLIDKSQAHDLAGVGEVGVDPNATIMNRFLSEEVAHRLVGARQKAMNVVSFMFHHTERANREVTFLAAYRMARKDGLDHQEAIDKASDLTWKAHFDYTNTARPRIMQNDWMKVALVFRNYQINMLWRLFRDVHQSLHGENAEVRREARTQLLGITGMMFLHAGIKGVWGYALLKMLIGLLMPGADDDDVEQAVQDALVNTFGSFAAGLILNGVPGTITGTSLTQRIGLPELWFRDNDRNLEGRDAYLMRLSEITGAAPGIIEGFYRGMQQVGEGQVWRGIETMAPKFVRDLLRSVRYMNEGVTTARGDLLTETSPMDALKQAIGFVPAGVAEAYERNTYLRNKQGEIEDARRAVLNRVAQDVKDGGALSDRARSMIDDFNRENPEWVITGKTIRTSLQERARYTQQTEGGLRINPKLDARLRAMAAAPVS